MCSRQCSVKMPFRDASGSGRRWHIFRQRVRVPCSGVNPLASAPRERLRSHGRFPHRPHLCSRRSHQSALTRATCQDSQVPFGWRGENPPRLVRAAWSGGKASPARGTSGAVVGVGLNPPQASACVIHRHSQTLWMFIRLHIRSGRGAFRCQALRLHRGSSTILEDFSFHRFLLRRVIQCFMAEHHVRKRL